MKKIERLVALLKKKVRTEGNIELREEMILSQEHQPGAYPTPVDIAREPIIDCPWLVTCARKTEVPNSSPAATYVQRWAVCSNRPANVELSVKRVEVIVRS